jgi:hypothetical protein
MVVGDRDGPKLKGGRVSPSDRPLLRVSTREAGLRPVALEKEDGAEVDRVVEAGLRAGK